MTTNRRVLVVVLSCLYLPPLGVLDIVSGSDLSLLVLYLVPIAATTWWAGASEALGVSVLAFVVWLFAALAFPNHVDLPPSALIIWSGLEKVAVFTGTLLLVTRVRRLLDAEHKRALTDFVTGLPNRRAFNAAVETAKARARPFSLVFMELGGLEDLYLDKGEAYVEALLREMASVSRRRLPGFRYADDRLAVLLPEVDGPTAVKRLSALMEALDKEVLGRRGLDLAYKVGIAFCEKSAEVSLPHLVRFLEGAMVNLHGREGDQLEFFQFN